MGTGKGNNKRIKLSVNSTEKENIMLWLDDIRTPPSDEWTWAKNIREAQEVLKSGNVHIASLDHDLGIKPDKFEEYTLTSSDEEGDKLEETGYDLVKWMAEHDIWPSESISVHSMNPVGRSNMLATCNRYATCRVLP